MFDNDFGVKKFKQRFTLSRNKMNGRVSENVFVTTERLKGNTVERTGHGHDFKVTKRDPISGKAKETKFYEVKSSKSARLSKLQKKKQKELGSKYVVYR